VLSKEKESSHTKLQVTRSCLVGMQAKREVKCRRQYTFGMVLNPA